MLEDIIKERRRKLEKILKQGVNPYPSSAKRTALTAEVLENFNRWEKSKKILFLVGRLRAWRDQGGIIFANLEDETGRFQLVFNEKQTKQFVSFKETLDIGDFVEVSGKLFKTKRGEKSLAVNSGRIISKSLRPLPTEWFGLKDAEERFRRRYLDLLLNPEVKTRLQKRSEITGELRKLLWADGFLEVETPMLQPMPGGAKAKPFKTRWEALREDVYLRIAPELYLKRLLVGGFEKIFEIGKNFRNEGIDREHYPEFTMLELYWAYQDYSSLMKFTKKILLKLVKSLKLKSTVFNHPWQTFTFDEVLKKFTPHHFIHKSGAGFIKSSQRSNLSNLNPEEAAEIFKKEICPKLINPTFIIDYPAAISPLAKSSLKDSHLVERFQLVVNGWELVNGYSELNNPEEQRRRLEEQEKRYLAGDQELSRVDQDFLEALEYGMPPAAGLGIGIDRLVAILTESHGIREIISFPMLKGK
ncbi:MAG: lysine--tRNA ligase [bacterium]|nr:lysine--tRNA ligase [bacterium]